MNKDCSDVSFPDFRRWIEHEFDVHQRAWKCNRCSKNYTSRVQFVDHMASRHSNSLSESQLSELTEICWFQRPQVPADDCPFCDEWAVRLREINQHVPHDLPILVSKKQYRQHVGAHMEQLALFAIGPPQADESEPESPSNKAVGESDQFQAIDSHEDSTSATGNITHLGVFSEYDLQQEEGNNDGNSQQKKGKKRQMDLEEENEALRLACPYWQKHGQTDQGRTKMYTSCKWPGFSSIARLK